MFNLKSTYLNSAYLGPMPIRAKENVERILQRMLDPAFYPHTEWRGMPDQIRAQLAGLLGGHADQVSINTSVSEVISHVADGLGLTAKDEILLMEGDYPSMVLPWMVRGERNGFKIKFAPQKDFLEPERLEKSISAKTKLVANTHVMFNTGVRLPSEQIAKMCKSRDLLYVTDISQSFGGMTVPRELVEHADVIVGVGYKWLLGPYGTGFGYFSKRALEKIARTHASWLQNPNSQNSENLLNYSTEATPGARKFDRGQPASFLICAAFTGALDLIREVGLEKIEKHNAGLVTHFVSHLPKKYEITAPTEVRSNIICINQKGLDSAALKEKLAKANIDVSVREGSLRMSFHFFNTEQDVDKLLENL